MLAVLRGTAMRSLLILLAGALIGALIAFSAANALHQRNAWPRGVMAVLQQHQAELRRLQRSGKCDPAVMALHLRRLAETAVDIGPSQPGEVPDFFAQAKQFADLGQRWAQQPPADCQGLDAPLQQIREACEGCHRDYR
ncbi:hypothetical protein DFR29_12510 [Tahibacter aquaticus]|uniref:Cytochrome c556 n=2 Tax=Tahibacter aquaticus TaxID=520092 RepID=A0A4R6YK08_9GAMM|nr:hypothetical protein DFR29_12510 [Tahibacter aquaticus]